MKEEGPNILQKGRAQVRENLERTQDIEEVAQSSRTTAW